ncbi:helix-turn-helix transcriptional regulator [Rhodohalobacter sp.]|uniref:helix-turn-helix domain-containing protein n=1 Tax=Rhodohalobacter sp. TaxID=1974210 RepID=UPI002ACEDAAE|nr:helix-turn-helix transcriptional regulator [Rhodohalobacter sp.]MDZ7757637.1 helix-turn-helix transcriptional regulator [Rhodohalobacter sp.]
MKRRFIKKQMDVAAQIYELLQQKGWTQSELAEKSGVSEQRVSTILSGHANPTLETLVKIEDALDMEVIVAPKFYKKELNRKGFVITQLPISEKFQLDLDELLSEVVEVIPEEKKFRSFSVKGYRESYLMTEESLDKKNHPQAA